MPGYDPTVSVEDVAFVFECKPDFLRTVMRTKPDLLTQKEAADYIGMPLRTFRHKCYRPAMRLSRKVQRYTKAQLNNLSR